MDEEMTDSEISNLEWRVVERSIALYYTDGSDESGNGSYMRSLYAAHKDAVDALIAAREKKENPDGVETSSRSGETQTTDQR